MIRIEVQPKEPRLDERLTVTVTGLPPGQRATVRCSTPALEAESWATFEADSAGTVDLSGRAPISGTFRVPDPMGLFWAAELADSADIAAGLEEIGKLPRLQCDITVEVNERQEATLPLARVIRQPGVRRLDVRDGRLRGVLFLPDGPGPHPAVLVLAGSGGGVDELRASLLAGQGIAALALGYFAYDDLPQRLLEIPLEYFGEALEWLNAHPEINREAIGVLGYSRGGELALLLGATFQQVRAVVALVPSPVMWASQGDSAGPALPSWTWRGLGLPTATPPVFDAATTAALVEAMTGPRTAVVKTDKPLSFAEMVLASMKDIRATDDAIVPVERIRAPILLVSGQEDQIWPSTPLCDLVVERLELNRFRYPIDHLSYPDAGHWVASPAYLPTTRTWILHEQFPVAMALGGTPEGNAASQADATPRIVRFLGQHLG